MQLIDGVRDGSFRCHQLIARRQTVGTTKQTCLLPNLNSADEAAKMLVIAALRSAEKPARQKAEYEADNDQTRSRIDTLSTTL